MLDRLAAMPAASKPSGVPEHECDRLTQALWQTTGKPPVFAEGVGYGTLRGSAARASCVRAITEQPGEVRFIVHTARSANKAGDARKVVRLYRLALDQGNALAQNKLGALYEVGEVALPRNGHEAERLSADQGSAGQPSQDGR